MKTAVIIPAYNESRTISKVIDKTKKYVKDIIIVDDGSKDNTMKIVGKKKVTVLHHIVNLGKGSALKTGCEYAIKKGAKNIIFMDADGQHDPKILPLFIKELKNNDIVFGYRTYSARMPFVFRFGNWVINKITEVLYGIKLRDTQCGYRAIKSSVYRKVKWQAQDYSVESEITAHVGRNKLKYKEIPIKTIYKNVYKGTTVLDGIKIVLKLLWWKVS